MLSVKFIFNLVYLAFSTNESHKCEEAEREFVTIVSIAQDKMLNRPPAMLECQPDTGAELFTISLYVQY